MKPVLLKVLTILGLKRKKPKTKLGRIARRCEHVLTAALILYFLVLIFPQSLFAHTFAHAGIALYSRQPISPEDAEALLSQIRSRIRTSDIHQESQTFRVFVCNSKALYTFLSPLSRHSFGNTPITGNVILANVNLRDNSATAFRPDNNQRSFVGVASHEICHVMIRRAFGLWSAYRAPKWLNEGYCEHVSGESSFPEKQGIDLLSQGKDADRHSFRYFVYRKMVDFCLTEQNDNISDLFSDPPSEQGIKRRTQQWASRQSSNNSMQATPNGAPDR